MQKKTHTTFKLLGILFVSICSPLAVHYLWPSSPSIKKYTSPIQATSPSTVVDTPTQPPASLGGFTKKNLTIAALAVAVALCTYYILHQKKQDNQMSIPQMFAITAGLTLVLIIFLMFVWDNIAPHLARSKPLFLATIIGCVLFILWKTISGPES